MKYHPDKNQEVRLTSETVDVEVMWLQEGAKERFQRISEAYDALKAPADAS